jgi:hypothetical protein
MKIILIVCFLLITSGINANPLKRANNFYNYRDPFNEIGYGINAAYMINEKQLVPVSHLYYSRYLTSFFSVGASYSGIYYKNPYHALSAKISLKFFKDLTLSFKPGVYFKNNLDRNQILYFFGIESDYQFKLNSEIGVGPMIDIHFIQDNIYLIGGFQMGFFF